MRIRNRIHILLFGAAIMVGMTSCNKNIIGTNGIHYAKIGQHMPPEETYKIKGKIVLDTVFVDEDHEWRGMVVEHKEGIVILEEDFYDHETLNRIRIETPELRTKNGLTVGKTVGDLAEVTKRWHINAMPRFERWDFYAREMPRIHFVIKDDGKIARGDTSVFKIEDFDPGIKIEAIVVY